MHTVTGSETAAHFTELSHVYRFAYVIYPAEQDHKGKVCK